MRTLITAMVLLVARPRVSLGQYPGYSVVVQLPAEGREGVLGEGRGPGSELRAERGPCTCIDDFCNCCTGVLLETFNQKGCVKFSYDPDDFALSVGVSMNDKTVYKNSVSGKNPKPICIPFPRISSLELCVKFSNVFLAGQNIHACVDMEGQFYESSLFKLSFDCMRLGANGVALLKPEDGGGLPAEAEDYEGAAGGEGPDYDIEGVGGPEDETPSALSNVTKVTNKVKNKVTKTESANQMDKN